MCVCMCVLGEVIYDAQILKNLILVCVGLVLTMGMLAIEVLCFSF